MTTLQGRWKTNPKTCPVAGFYVFGCLLPTPGWLYEQVKMRQISLLQGHVAMETCVWGRWVESLNFQEVLQCVVRLTGGLWVRSCQGFQSSNLPICGRERTRTTTLRLTNMEVRHPLPCDVCTGIYMPGTHLAPALIGKDNIFLVVGGPK